MGAQEYFRRAMAIFHILAQGECLQTIARRYGFFQAATIWDHPENADLRKARTSMHVLAPGDVIHVPDPEKRVVDCATGKSHVFRVHLPKRGVHVILIDADGQAIAGSPYVLKVGSVERKGRTGSDGAIDEKGFRPDVDRGELELTDLGITRTLLIGHLDPHHGDSGSRQRLANLGYGDDEEGLAEFASDQGLPEGMTREAMRDAVRQESKS
jgi:N-acetylmuramoyl-L-alanine amidase